MKNAQEQLATIGFGAARREPECWRTARIARAFARAPAPDQATDPSCSSALARWQRLLAQRPLPQGYRISRR